MWTLCPQYGLYGSFLGCLVYIFLGSCKDVPMGPTAITALLVYQSLHGHSPQFGVLLCFLTGLVQLLMGVFGLGKATVCPGSPRETPGSGP